jgi:hypothetical protein
MGRYESWLLLPFSVAVIRYEPQDFLLVVKTLTRGIPSGRYHTHGNAGGGPSSTDIANADADRDVTTSQYRLHFLSDPCGLIYKYQGPNAALWNVLSDRTDTSIRCTP